MSVHSEIVDSAGPIHFGQMWGGEMLTFLGDGWGCTADDLPEPYSSIAGRMCTYARFLSSVLRDGKPEEFHGFSSHRRECHVWSCHVMS